MENQASAMHRVYDFITELLEEDERPQEILDEVREAIRDFRLTEDKSTV